MARKTEAVSSRRTSNKRKERRTFVPASTVINPTEQPVQDVVAPVRSARRTAVSRTIGVPLSADYGYVARDLRKIFMTAGGLLAGLVLLSLFVR